MVAYPDLLRTLLDRSAHTASPCELFFIRAGSKAVSRMSFYPYYLGLPYVSPFWPGKTPNEKSTARKALDNLTRTTT